MAAAPVSADTIRIATFAAPLSRDGPGLLLRDIGKDDPQIAAIAAVIADTRPDILLLTDFDYDYDSIALKAFQVMLAATGLTLDHRFATQPNTGQMTAFDLDQNGRLGEARDAQGYGRFAGDGGMAVLSRWPIATIDVRDYSALLWQDLPGAQLPPMPEGVAQIQRLSTSGHWIVPVDTPDGPINLMAFAATPPVFDGPEDRNGLRNRDELRFWSLVLDGAFGPPPPDFVVLGNANLDPSDGDGLRPAIAEFLADPRLIDPMPRSAGGAQAADPDQFGDPALDTADWPDGAPGNLRVSYVLPARSFTVIGAGVVWPSPNESDLLGSDGLLTGPHRLVWVDVIR